MISNSTVTDGSAQAADVNTPSIDDQTASHQPPRPVSAQTDIALPYQPIHLPPQLQPQLKDPRFKNVEVRLYGRAVELYREIVTAFPEKVLEMWDEHYEKEVLEIRDRYYDREKTLPVTRTADEMAHWTRTRVEREFQDVAKDIEKEEARQRRLASPEYKEAQEKKRIKREKADAEHNAKIDFWFANAGKRRLHDALLINPFPGIKKLPSERELNHTGAAYAHEFYREFFSEAFTGYDALYDHRMGGYRFPEESGIGHLVFKLNGDVWDQSGYDETGEWDDTEKDPCTGFIRIYAAWVCGYDCRNGHILDLDDWEKAHLGYAVWLNERLKEKHKEKQGYKPGTPEYWLNLFGHITLGLFKDYTDEELDKSPSIIEAPRKLFKTVTVPMEKEERELFSVFEGEKAFKQFMLDCMPGGRYAEIADLNKNCFFTVADASRTKAERYKITFSRPEDRELPMEVVKSIMGNVGLKLHTMEKPPEKWPINWEKVNAEAAEIRERLEREWDESQA
jgi:hypothetical protein